MLQNKVNNWQRRYVEWVFVSVLLYLRHFGRGIQDVKSTWRSFYAPHNCRSSIACLGERDVFGSVPNSRHQDYMTQWVEYDQIQKLRRWVRLVKIERWGGDSNLEIDNKDLPSVGSKVGYLLMSYASRTGVTGRSILFLDYQGSLQPIVPLQCFMEEIDFPNSNV
jgi:hypothetical protein